MKPYLLTLFRSKPLFLVPAVALPLLVFALLRLLPPTYAVGATLWVDPATEETPSYSAAAPSAGAVEARTFSDHLRTEAFRVQLLRDAGLAGAIDAGRWPDSTRPLPFLDRFSFTRPLASLFWPREPASREEAWGRAAAAVLARLTVSDRGENLLSVTYRGTDRDVGLRLVSAAIDAYQSEKQSAARRKIDSSGSVQNPVVTALESEVARARTAYTDASQALPEAPTAAQQRQVSDLQKAYQDAAYRLEQLRLSQAQATLQTLNDWTNKTTTLTVVDPPGGGEGPILGLKLQLALTFVAALLGAALGATLIVLRTWLDGTVRDAGDIETRLGLPVLGELPVLPGRRRRTA